jgi:hypothetical protein
MIYLSLTVTVEVKNQRTLDLLKAIEGVGLIHVNSSEKPEKEKTPPYHWLQGCCKNIPGGSAEDFLVHCREDKVGLRLVLTGAFSVRDAKYLRPNR